MFEPALFRPTYRIIGYSLAVGVFGAGAALLFDATVEWAQLWLLGGLGGYHPPRAGGEAAAPLLPAGLDRLWLPLVTTLGGLLSGLIVYRFAPEAEGHGTDAAIAAYHQEGAEIRTRIPLIKGISSALTIGSGGVAGREGPTALIAAGMGGVIARIGGLRGLERRVLLLASMAAGLSAMFRAPLGMAIFAVEILYAGLVFESEALIYTVIAAVTAYACYGIIAGWDRLFVIPADLAFDEPLTLVGFALLGVLAGLLGAVLPTLLYSMRALFRRLPGPRPLRPALGGLIIGLVALAVPQILGGGYGWVQLAIDGRLELGTALPLLLLIGPAMAITIGSGGSGGVFAPTISLGAMLGATIGLGLDLLMPEAGVPVSAFVVVGMAAIFAAAARTPISTLIMVLEMTGGYVLIVPAMLANILAFVVQRSLTTGRRWPTLYESQVERPEESPLHRGVFVRRALDMVERGQLHASEIRLPRLMSLLRYGEPIPVAEGEGRLVSLAIEPGSALAHTTVAESLGKIEGATAVAILRGGEMLVPRGPTEILPGDRLLAVTNESGQATLEGLAAGDRESGPET